MDLKTFPRTYREAEAEWETETLDTNTCVEFPPNDSVKQDTFFRAVEEMCKGLGNMPKDDYRTNVAPVSLLHLPTTVG